MFGRSKSGNEPGEDLLSEFTYTLLPYSQQTWPKGFTYKWSRFSSSVHVKSGQEMSPANAPVRYFFKEEQIPTPSEEAVGVVDVAPESRAADYTSSELTENPKITINNGYRGDNYRQTDPVKYCTLADVSRTHEN